MLSILKLYKLGGNKMIKAVIFDMDGLMIDSERVTFEGYKIELEKRNYETTEAFYIKTLGKTIKTVYQIYFDEYGNDFPIDEVIQDVHRYIEKEFEEKGVPIKKGLLPLLQYLKDHQIKTIVATSSSRVRTDRILKQANITQYFDDSICGDEVTNGKPDPEVFLKACQKLNVLPSEAIVLEDSEAGIQAAANANIKVICIPDMKYPEPQYEKLTYKLLDDLSKVIPIIGG